MSKARAFTLKRSQALMLISPWFTRLAAEMTSRLPIAVKWRLSRWVDGIQAAGRLAPDSYLTVRRQGCLWALNPRDYVDRDLLWKGDKDGREIAIISRNLKQGARLMDIGANFGYYSVVLAKLLKGHCVIDSFEPYAPTFERLQSHIRMNQIKCVRLHPFALGDCDGERVIVPCHQNSGAAHLTAYSADAAACKVRVRPLDHFLRSNNVAHVDFVKLDVEGYEYAVLKGGALMLGQWAPVLMVEICPSNLAREGVTVEMLMSLLRQLGYKHFLTCSPAGVQEFAKDSFSGGWSYRNVFCLPSGHMWKMRG